MPLLLAGGSWPILTCRSASRYVFAAILIVKCKLVLFFGEFGAWHCHCWCFSVEVGAPLNHYKRATFYTHEAQILGLLELLISVCRLHGTFGNSCGKHTLRDRKMVTLIILIWMAPLASQASILSLIPAQLCSHRSFDLPKKNLR